MIVENNNNQNIELLDENKDLKQSNSYLSKELHSLKNK